MITLTGNLKDVTTRPVGDIVTMYVKAPAPRPGGGGVVVDSPAAATYDPGTGELEIHDLRPGLSWLVIEGLDWSDPVKLVAADGMTLLLEAVANASGPPGFVDYVRLVGNIDEAVAPIQEYATNARESANAAKVSEDNALNSANAAKVSEDNALNSANAAKVSEDNVGDARDEVADLTAATLAGAEVVRNALQQLNGQGGT